MGCVGSKNQRSEEPAAPAGGSGGFLDGATEPVLLAFIKPGARWEDDFTISFTTLGVGKWGTVKLAYNKHTGDKVAFKVLKKKMLAKRPARVSRIIEVETHALACSQNETSVVKLEAVYEDDKNIYIAMEHCKGGDLYSHISSFSSRKKHFTEETIRSLLRPAFQAVAQLHDRGLVHRDIKPENMLFAGEAGDQLKLCDFGSAERFSLLKGPKANAFMDFVSTAWYTAPEVFTHKYSAQCDAWALGVTLLVLLTGPPPPLNSDQCKQDSVWLNMQKGKVLLPVGVSAQLRDLVTSLLNPRPEQRLTVREALKHEWFTGVVEEESLDLEDSMRGVMAYVNTRNMLRAAVLVVGVFLNEKQLGRLVQSIEQSQKSTISILRLEQTLMDMEETTCMTHLTEARSRLEARCELVKPTNLSAVTMPVYMFRQLLDHTREQEVWKRTRHQVHEGSSVTHHGASSPDPGPIEGLLDSANERQTQRQQLYDSAPGLNVRERSLSRRDSGHASAPSPARSARSRRDSDTRSLRESTNSNSNVRVLFDEDGLPKLDVASVINLKGSMDSINTVHGGNMIKDHLDLSNRGMKHSHSMQGLSRLESANGL